MDKGTFRSRVEKKSRALGFSHGLEIFPESVKRSIVVDGETVSPTFENLWEAIESVNSADQMIAVCRELGLLPDLEDWREIGSYGGRLTLIDGGKFRQQRITAYEHVNTPEVLVAGEILVDSRIVGYAQRQRYGTDVESLAKEVGLALGMDEFTLAELLKNWEGRSKK